MIQKVFWAGTILAMTAAGMVYVVARHADKTPMEVSSEAVTHCAHYLQKQTRVVEWDKLQETVKKGNFQQALTPTPVVGEEMEFTLPNDLIAEAPSTIPAHIDIEQQGTEDHSPSVGSVSDAHSTKSGSDATHAGVMPYCEDGLSTPRMPYADENDASKANEAIYNAIVEGVSVGGSEACETTGFEPELPYAEVDPHYHQHYPCCPYTGKCAKPAPSTQPQQEKEPTVEEIFPDLNELQSKFKKIQKQHRLLQLKQELLPRRYDIDTMEARPGDLNEKPFLPDL